MSPLSEDKFLLRFLGKTLLQYQIEQATKAGLTEFVIIGNPSNIDAIESIAQGMSGVRPAFAVQQKPLGMADALLSASALLADGPFVLVNSNDIFETSAYAQLLDEHHRNGGYSGYLIARQVQEYFPGGYLSIDEDSKIDHIIEKPGEGNEPSKLVNIVVHLHNEPRELLKCLAETSSTTDDVYEQTLNRMINDGHKMKAVIYTDSWRAIKYPWHVLDTMDYFLGQVTRQVSPTAQVSEKAVIDGDVVIGENVRVHEGAVIRGPSYVGQNSVIGNGALVRNSVVGEDCVLGYGTEVKHSYIGDKCWFHLNFFGDSVVGNDCCFGAGTITANLRLDEGRISVKFGDERIDTGLNKLGALIGNGVRTGIHVGLMPGIRLGAGSVVGPHVCLSQNLPLGETALATGGYRIVGDVQRMGD